MRGVLRLYRDDGVEPWLLEELRGPLAEIYGLPVLLGGDFALLAEEFHAGRGQYRSSDALRRLCRLRAGQDLLLALTCADLFVPGLNYVFGEADPRGGCAIVSLARLGSPDRATFLRRALVEAVHEVGHLCRLGHCANPLCVMHFSNSLDDTDRKSERFCPFCRPLLP